MDLLLHRLRAAGFDAVTAEAAHGGVVALAGLATLRDGSRVFAKTLRAGADDLFEVEAEGLRALSVAGLTTPEVLAVTPRLLVLEPLPPRRDDDERFWEQLARDVAHLHTTTRGDRFGWHRDGWLGRLRQDNTWHSDGHAFLAQRRILRWLPEPLVEAAFDAAERRALERLCAALPELLPPRPPVLTHGDLWRENILSGRAGGAALIDPAVSYSWAEADLSMLWCSPRPPDSDRFFEVYADAAGLEAGWRDRLPLFHLRELLSSIAHDDYAAECAEAVREIIAPFA
ncbi:aminoglycoside phosphotransferase [Nonomuraea mesophila]|uniref:Aminoglycoside phosphotransferase n=1 Tax=Nonomuraea mesophila TaxID=2530382 RepID=A0A4R5F5Q4_9ACTN|nr:fructosamine kinase family protein [Nonomuraea mesophila]TDE42604.1 aminoglycoside phosphotransferase [Nonomuraea mesophila]